LRHLDGGFEEPGSGWVDIRTRDELDFDIHECFGRLLMHAINASELPSQVVKEKFSKMHKKARINTAPMAPN